MVAAGHGSQWVGQQAYWWYRARGKFFDAFFGPLLSPHAQVLDIGSADGPSAKFIDEILKFGTGRKISMDIDPEGLGPDDIVASAEAIPVADESFDMVSAFDVIEHCEHEALAVGEIHRVLKPGGYFFMAVPAYQWAWSNHDVEMHHYRRYTVKRARAALERAGFTVQKSSYAYRATFIPFLLQRLASKLRHSFAGASPEVSPLQDRILMWLCGFDRRALQRGSTLHYGSSVLIVGKKAS